MAALSHEAISHPLAFIVGMLVFPLIAGTSIGAAVSPFALREQTAALSAQTDALNNALTVHIDEFQRQVTILRISQCEQRNAAAVYSFESQLRTIDQERWTLQGLIDSRQASPRDRERLGNLNSDRESVTRRLQKTMTTDCHAWARDQSAGEERP